jgi:hypothetical protein
MLVYIFPWDPMSRSHAMCRDALVRLFVNIHGSLNSLDSSSQPRSNRSPFSADRVL